MEKNQELIVITKTYDLILWSCRHTGKFPRNHRFVLGERIERNLYDLLETLIRAKYTRDPASYWRRPTSCWKSSASRYGSPRTCSACAWTATASRPRPSTRSAS